jgi:hypothetical protein
MLRRCRSSGVAAAQGQELPLPTHRYQVIVAPSTADQAGEMRLPTERCRAGKKP